MENYEAINAAQLESELDLFTVDRYCQFFRHFLPTTRTVLDVECNTG